MNLIKGISNIDIKYSKFITVNDGILHYQILLIFSPININSSIKISYFLSLTII